MAETKVVVSEDPGEPHDILSTPTAHRVRSRFVGMVSPEGVKRSRYLLAGAAALAFPPVGVPAFGAVVADGILRNARHQAEEEAAAKAAAEAEAEAQAQQS